MHQFSAVKEILIVKDKNIIGERETLNCSNTEMEKNKRQGA